MTEAEWLAATDPTPMLEFLKGKAGDRKLRLFAVACCQSIWHLLPNESARNIVNIAERFADGKASDDEVLLASSTFDFTEPEEGYAPNPYSASLAIEAVEQIGRESDSAFARRTRRVVASWPEQAYEAAWGTLNAATHSLPLPKRRTQPADLSARLRCIFGNPFRPVAVDPSWLSSTAVAIAQGIYGDKAFDRLSILADAVQDAGCENADILNHLRSDGPHVRGCWALDLVLGKE